MVETMGSLNIINMDIMVNMHTTWFLMQLLEN